MHLKQMKQCFELEMLLFSQLDENFSMNRKEEGPSGGSGTDSTDCGQFLLLRGSIDV